MKYKLAKKLKDAGFPQKGGSSHEAYYLNAGQNCGVVDFDMYKDVEDDFRDGKLVYIPTLSELIEACGTPFALKIHEEKESEWFAANDVEGFACEAGYGLTPEEAVANLWLELNKNGRIN